jgi:nitrate/nitrite transport system ATP-binding protein
MDEPFGALDALTRGSIQDELISICRETGQTVFMITHDVDESLYLSDRVLLMSNGPGARIAEVVEVDLPRPRHRALLAKDQRYFNLRTELVDFLVTRAGQSPQAGPPGTTPVAPDDSAPAEPSPIADPPRSNPSATTHALLSDASSA